MKIMKTASLNNKLINLLPDTSKFEPELFRNFLTYWIMRKSGSINSAGTLKEMKNSNPSQWFNLIESNHKFRNLYGEETATTIIELIQKTEI